MKTRLPELHITPITGANRPAACALDVAPDQRRHIETVSECLAEADAEPRWKPVALYAGDTMVGFAMYGCFPNWIGEGNEDQVWLDRLLIDRRFQGHGYGEAALVQLLDHLAEAYGIGPVYLSVYGDNSRAIALYAKHGFAFTGALDTKGEKVMRREAR